MNLKQHWKWLLPLLLVPLVIIAGTDPSNVFRLGNKAASNKRIILDRGGSNPEIRWNEATSQMQVSNDGSVFSDIPGTAPTGYGKIENLTLTASAAANALTIAVKTLSGADPSASDVVRVAFRSNTASYGTYEMRELTSALSLTISSGSTLGQSSSTTEPIYVYMFDNAGTLGLAATTTAYDDGFRRGITAEGGAGGADDRYTIYGTSAGTFPVRLIGRIFTTQVTAGTWANNASDIALWPFYFTKSNQLYQESPISVPTALPGGIAASVDCLTDTITATSYATVNCASGDITVTVVTSGRPVELSLEPIGTSGSRVRCSESPSASVGCALSVTYSGTSSGDLGPQEMTLTTAGASSVFLTVPPSSFRWRHYAAQGTYTYLLRGYVLVGGDELLLENVRLVAREL